MAVSSHIAPTPQASAATAGVLAFLRAATELVSTIWSAHQDAADDESANQAGTVAQNGNRLRSELLAAAADIKAATDAPHDLLRECAKLGQDVVLRLDRLQDTANDATTAWSLVDLAVLADRLESVIHRAQDVEKSLFDAEELRQLEKKLSFRQLPDAPPSDEYYTGADSSADSEYAKQHPDRKKLNEIKDLRKNIHPANRPRQVPADILNDFILEGLAYKSMHDREDEVTEAYASTFDWVFADEAVEEQSRPMKHNLKNWLTTTESGPIYWITGKPGSGKSTFIRYLYQHVSTTQCLDIWGGEKPVILAGFFFWTSGSREQRSQTGLLRSLLHQFLSKNPEYIATSFPTLWEKLCKMPTKERIMMRLDWTVAELLPAFLSFIRAVSQEKKVCLFIDGMDEFEGDHTMIVDLFKSLATGPGSKNVKMCLSSRPWAVFQNAFEFTVPNMKLQELTYGDMHQFVAENLQENEGMRLILQMDKDKEAEFINALIERADGVFLWVRLAVEKVLERFDKDAGVESLKILLHSLPGDLDDLFYKLLFEDQTTDEMQQSAALYSLMRAREDVADFVNNDSANSLTIWELAFALAKEDDKMVLDKIEVEEAGDNFIQERQAATVATVHNRFCGLLGLHTRSRDGNIRHYRTGKLRNTQRSLRDHARSRIVYIHRTVRDWLVSCPGIHEQLMGQLAPDFDPNLRLLRSYVLQMKRPISEIEHHRMLDDWWPGITLALTHARHIVNDKEGLQRSFVNELEATIGWWWETKPTDEYDHWARNAYGTYELRMKAPPIWQPFLCLAVKFGLRTYVKEEMAARLQQDAQGDISDEMKKLQVEDAVPLLAYATEFLCSRKKTIFPLSDPGLVKDLLTSMSRINRGANHPYLEFVTRTDTTAWLAVLRHLRDAHRRRWIKLYDVDADGTARWAEVVRLFLDVGGADPFAVVKADMWDPEITAMGVVELLDGTYGDAEIRKLKGTLEGLQRKSGKNCCD